MGRNSAAKPPTELHHRVIERIRALAEERKIAISHLPDRAGVARSHFWDVLAGRTSPTLAWLLKVAVALDVDVVTLVEDRQRGGAPCSGSQASPPRP